MCRLPMVPRVGLLGWGGVRGSGGGRVGVDLLELVGVGIPGVGLVGVGLPGSNSSPCPRSCRRSGSGRCGVGGIWLWLLPVLGWVGIVLAWVWLRVGWCRVGVSRRRGDGASWLFCPWLLRLGRRAVWLLPGPWWWGRRGGWVGLWLRRRHNWFVGSVGGWGVSGHPQGVGWAGSWRFNAAECADVELFGWFRSQVVRLTHAGGGGWLGWFLPPESPWLVGLFGLHDTRIWLLG